MAPAGAGDAAGADLPLLGDELPQRRDVLVVDLVDLVAAERAGLAPAPTGSASLLTPPGGLSAVPLLRQSLESSSSRKFCPRARIWRAPVVEDSRGGRVALSAACLRPGAALSGSPRGKYVGLPPAAPGERAPRRRPWRISRLW